ncbi:hypothetical protein FRC09_020485 [Ceratobasidium sp. 395]|nr:hypothetical protein FRC09_020485 [Ceratobasidium sp. 395]
MTSQSINVPPNADLENLQAAAAALELTALDHGKHLPLALRWGGQPLGDEELVFRTERWNKKHRSMRHLKLKKGEIHVDSGEQVIPNLEDSEKLYHLVGFASPLTDGARRASRAMSGQTPLYGGQSHQDLWQMQTLLVYALVNAPRAGTVSFFGCEIPMTVYPSARHSNVEYAAQNPDSTYLPLHDAMIARSAVLHAQNKTTKLVPWEDPDLSDERVWYMNKWTVDVMRLELKLAPNPNNPKRLAMLGRCRDTGRPKSQRRAPRTREEWLAIPESESAFGDDEQGESDAGSINDDVACGLPTSSTWDPVTKKSTTPRGNVPHPYPNVVVQELERNRAWDEEHPHSRAGAGPSRTLGRVRGAGLQAKTPGARKPRLEREPVHRRGRAQLELAAGRATAGRSSGGMTRQVTADGYLRIEFSPPP